MGPLALSELSIFHEVSRGRFANALVLTYTAQLDCLERRLWSKLAATLNRILIVDEDRLLEEIEEVAELGSVRGANRTYLASSIRVAGSFHPKVVLLSGQADALALVGSGNATLPGMSRSGEQYAVYRYPEDAP